jgi:hypothetical protein
MAGLLLLRLTKGAACNVGKCFNAVHQYLFKAGLFGLGLLIAYVSVQLESWLSRDTNFKSRDFTIGSDSTYIASTYATQFGNACNRQPLHMRILTNDAKAVLLDSPAMANGFC